MDSYVRVGVGRDSGNFDAGVSHKNERTDIVGVFKVFLYRIDRFKKLGVISN